ncbi:hypothetical protein bmLB2001_001029 (plasmid) [Borrelia miyamotoi]|nr:hypothetical protein bmLB2001_001029 [Borrelia miyamotoi]
MGIVMNRKEIKFPVNKKGLKAKDIDIEEFIEQVDANIEQMDREFKEFQRRYGADKSFDDWMAYEEEDKRKKERRLQSKVEHLSFNFKKELRKNLRKK